MKINSNGVGRGKGKFDNFIYYEIDGQTFARRIPSGKKSKTDAQKISIALFTLIQVYATFHAACFRDTFEKTRFGSYRNTFTRLNNKPLRLALAELAQRMVNGETIRDSEIEAAVTAYATAHPDEILVASRDGYRKVYLTGAWPAVINLIPRVETNTQLNVLSVMGYPTSVTNIIVTREDLPNYLNGAVSDGGDTGGTGNDNGGSSTGGNQNPTPGGSSDDSTGGID
ncbi:MAG: hypothetical protein HUK17_04215 [Bacteroidales bacterium]|nr:hypothetical protein [Bacteroidales bacterium]